MWWKIHKNGFYGPTKTHNSGPRFRPYVKAEKT
jgi:hypothetical protein